MTTDVYTGKDLGTLELPITDEMVQHYIKGLDEPNPWYTTAMFCASPAFLGNESGIVSMSNLSILRYTKEESLLPRSAYLSMISLTESKL